VRQSLGDDEGWGGGEACPGYAGSKLQSPAHRRGLSRLCGAGRRDDGRRVAGDVQHALDAEDNAGPVRGRALKRIGPKKVPNVSNPVTTIRQSVEGGIYAGFEHEVYRA
jgi:hypothetical protein